MPEDALRLVPFDGIIPAKTADYAIRIPFEGAHSRFGLALCQITAQDGSRLNRFVLPQVTEVSCGLRAKRAAPQAF